MPSLKTLKSVAHNLAHHFASTLNYWKDDYAIHHLWRAAQSQNESKVRIDVLAKRLYPEKLHNGKAAEIIPPLYEFLAYLLNTQDLSLEVLSSATIEYEFHNRRSRLYDLPVYECVVTLTTISGKVFTAELTENDN